MDRMIRIENAQVLPGAFRNFSGNPTPFNKAGGDRTFCIKLEPEQADFFRSNGFNVQEKVNTQDPAAVTYVLSIKVSFRVAPPDIIMISGGRGTRLDEITVGLLDSAEIQSADIAINPYEYEVNGRHGFSAYLRTLYVTIAENPYADKYRDLVMTNAAEAMPFE